MLQINQYFITLVDPVSQEFWKGMADWLVSALWCLGRHLERNEGCLSFLMAWYLGLKHPRRTRGKLLFSFMNDPQKSHSVTSSAVTNWPGLEGRVSVNRKTSSCKKGMRIRENIAQSLSLSQAILSLIHGMLRAYSLCPLPLPSPFSPATKPRCTWCKLFPEVYQ